MPRVKVGRSAECPMVIGIQHDAAVRTIARFRSTSAIGRMRQRVVEVEGESFTQRMPESERSAVETGGARVGPNIQTTLLRSVERPAAGHTYAVGEGFAANAVEPVCLVERIRVAQSVVHQ